MYLNTVTENKDELTMNIVSTSLIIPYLIGYVRKTAQTAQTPISLECRLTSSLLNNLLLCKITRFRRQIAGQLLLV